MTREHRHIRWPSESEMIAEYGPRIRSGDRDFDLLTDIANQSWTMVALGPSYESERPRMREAIEEIRRLLAEYDGGSENA